MIQVNWNSFGKHLRAERKHKNITLETLSQATGIHKATLSKVENGKQVLKLNQYLNICVFLEIPLNKILFLYKRKNEIKVAFNPNAKLKNVV